MIPQGLSIVHLCVICSVLPYSLDQNGADVMVDDDCTGGLSARGPPGFPTVHSLSVRGELKNAGVNVFGSASKKESLILRVGKGGDPNLLMEGEVSGGGAGVGPDTISAMTPP